MSLTTRAPREAEVEGVDYCFVSEEEFKRRESSGDLAEWARVFESSYGTPRAPLDDAIAAGRDILLDIDIQGARQIRAGYQRDAVTIFVLPPSFEELEERLQWLFTNAGYAVAAPRTKRKSSIVYAAPGSKPKRTPNTIT